MLFLYFIPFLIGASTAVTSEKLQTLYEWQYFDYDWPSAAMKQEYVRKGLYNYTSIFPVDVDRSLDGRTFVTTVGFGVPASVNVVTQKVAPNGNLLMPYPNWNYHRPNDCNTIQTVYRVSIDKCNRIWILDSGTCNMKPVCPVKLWVFDLKNDQLLRTIVIPKEFSGNSKDGRTLVITPAVEYDLEDVMCTTPRVYMADVVGHGLIVYDGKTNKVSRIEDPSLEPDVEQADFQIDGRDFHLEDGIFSVAVSPTFYPGNQKYLMYRPLASRDLHVTNPEYALAAGPNRPFDYITYKNVFPSQVTVMAFSQDGTLFYALTHETAIGCWNAKKPMAPGNMDIAIKDSDRLQFTGGLKVAKNYMGVENLYILTSSLQRVWTGTLKFDEINFRVTSADVRSIKANTKCSSAYSLPRNRFVNYYYPGTQYSYSWVYV